MNKFFITMFILTILAACTKLPEGPDSIDNPLDPSSPNYRPPEVTIINGPANNQTINHDSVTFTWGGNIPTMEFRHHLNDEPWSQFSNVTTAHYDLLDDQTHIFKVQGKYATGVIGDETVISFTVDAIQAPSLFMYPKKVIISNGDEFDVDLWAEVDSGIAVISARAEYNPTLLSVEDIIIYETQSDALLLKNGGQLIAFKEINNTTGYVQVDCAVYYGIPRDITGIGKIAKITCRHKSGSEANLHISESSQLRSSTNQTVTVTEFIGSKIIVH